MERPQYDERILDSSKLSPSLAIACNILYTILYVAPLHLSPTLRSTPLNSRDSPACIRARARAVAIVCAACTLITASVLSFTGAATDALDLCHQLGLYPTSLSTSVQVLSLTAVLFSCSLYERFIVDGEASHFSSEAVLDALWRDWRSMRNLVLAPATEELVFRALVIPLYLHAGVRPATIVFASPLVFGVAHAHHLVEFLHAHTPRGAAGPSRAVWMKGILRTLFQFTYTSLFGFFAAFVLIRTGSLCITILVHSFCNWMGVPRLWGRVGPEEDDEVSAAGGGIGWTVVYYALVPIGMYGFATFLWPWTESEHALAYF